MTLHPLLAYKSRKLARGTSSMDIFGLVLNARAPTYIILQTFAMQSKSSNDYNVDIANFVSTS